MTTETESTPTARTPRWSAEESRAERNRNKAYWAEHAKSLRNQYPGHWIIIYGGDRVVAVETVDEMVMHSLGMDDFTRRCSYRIPPRRNEPRARVVNMRQRP